jgi:uncharacterized protein with HEPN domain
MQRDPRAFLWDVRESALAIQSFVAGMNVAAYADNAMAQAAVERKFEIIGEALNQLAKFDAATAARIPDLAQIIAFSQPAFSQLRHSRCEHSVEHCSERPALTA